MLALSSMHVGCRSLKPVGGDSRCPGLECHLILTWSWGGSAGFVASYELNLRINPVTVIRIHNQGLHTSCILLRTDRDWAFVAQQTVHRSMTSSQGIFHKQISCTYLCKSNRNEAVASLCKSWGWILTCHNLRTRFSSFRSKLMHIELLAISRSPGAASPVLLSVKSYVRRRGSCKRAWVRAYTDQTKKINSM